MTRLDPLNPLRAVASRDVSPETDNVRTSATRCSLFRSYRHSSPLYRCTYSRDIIKYLLFPLPSNAEVVQVLYRSYTLKSRSYLSYILTFEVSNEYGQSPPELSLSLPPTVPTRLRIRLKRIPFILPFPGHPPVSPTLDSRRIHIIWTYSCRQPEVCSSTLPVRVLGCQRLASSRVVVVNS